MKDETLNRANDIKRELEELKRMKDALEKPDVEKCFDDIIFNGDFSYSYKQYTALNLCRLNYNERKEIVKRIHDTVADFMKELETEYDNL